MTALHRVYLDGTDLERDSEAFMRFRLTYEGSLKSSQPTHKECRDGIEWDRRGEHKHAIRRKFHTQLKRYWESHPFLSQQMVQPGPHSRWLPEGAISHFPEDERNRFLPMNEVRAKVFGHSGYGFVPFVVGETSLACSLRIFILRQDGQGAMAAGRDIDNRVKTLIDALRFPEKKQGQPMENGAVVPPYPDENPVFYTLLDDDKNVTHLEVETDTDLRPLPPGKDDSYVRLTISVEIRPIHVYNFNLGFACPNGCPLP